MDENFEFSYFSGLSHKALHKLFLTAITGYIPQIAHFIFTLLLEDNVVIDAGCYSTARSHPRFISNSTDTFAAAAYSSLAHAIDISGHHKYTMFFRYKKFLPNER